MNTIGLKNGVPAFWRSVIPGAAAVISVALATVPGGLTVLFRGTDWWGGTWMARDISVWAAPEVIDPVDIAIGRHTDR